MAQLNSISPTTFTTGMLVTDTNDDGSVSNTITAGAALDIQSTLGALVVPRMTGDQITDNDLPSGSIIYNTDTNLFNLVQGGTPTPTPVNPVPILANNTNIFIGLAAGNTTALSESTATLIFGEDAGFNLADGSGNIIIGNGSSNDLVDGFNNVAVGTDSLALTIHGTDNTAIGTSALENGITLSGCTALGMTAGSSHDNLTQCTFLGFGADSTVGGLTNATAVGANAHVTTSNSLVLGNSANVGIGTTSPTSRLHVVGNINPGILATSNVMALSANGGIAFSVTPTAVNYLALASDYFIVVTDTSAARTVKLPVLSAANAFQVFYVKDGGGTAGTHNITIDGNGANIDGTATVLITTNHGSRGFINDGTVWWSFAQA